MDEDRVCPTCTWWHYLTDTDALCKRHAPVVIQSGPDAGITEWPMTEPEDSCGDWEAVPVHGDGKEK